MRRLNRRILRLLDACFSSSEAGGFEQEEQCEPGVSDAAKETEAWLIERMGRYAERGPGPLGPEE